MKKPLTLTERAIRQLTDMALTLHYAEFRKRLDRLHGRLIGEMEADKVGIEIERVER